MKIGIVGSMQFAEKMIETKLALEKLGHLVFVSMETESLVGKSDKEKETIKLDQKFNKNAIKEFWHKMDGSDAVLVLNYDKNGVANYIGGNSLLDIGIAYYLNQKIFLMNPIPEIPYYKSEIEAVNPIIINEDLSKIV
jgi:hypothetical protein